MHKHFCDGSTKKKSAGKYLYCCQLLQICQRKTLRREVGSSLNFLFYFCFGFILLHLSHRPTVLKKKVKHNKLSVVF